MSDICQKLKHCAKQISTVEAIDAIVPDETQVSPGLTVLAMALDFLSGRRPLCRLQNILRIRIPNCCWAKRLVLGHLQIILSPA
jgi:hypothetical protein